MSGINSSFSHLNVSGFSGVNTELAIKPTSPGDKVITLKFDPNELGYSNPRTRPPELRLTDRQVEQQLLKQLGLDLKTSGNLAIVNKRLETDNPFQAMRTTGPNLATYNADTGKYEMKQSVDSNLYSKLKGWAETAKADIAAAKQDKPNQTTAPQTVTNDPNAPQTIKVFVPLTKAEVDQTLADSALLSYVSDRYGYEKTGLFGENIINIRDEAKSAGVKAIKPEITPVGNKQWVRLEITLSDAKKIDDIFIAERNEVTRQTDIANETKHNSAGNKFAEGFLRGAWNDLKGNAEMIYDVASDPLGSAWKIGEAVASIPALSVKIGTGIGQAAIELANLTPEQRQGLINELVAKGHTELANMPVSVAAEKAGEIVGTIAMELILGKGVGLGLKGLQALKGTAFLSKIESLAQSTKQTIASIEIPSKITIVQTVDTMGGTGLPNIVTEKKPLGEILTMMESRAKQVLSGGDEISRVKPINLPAFEKLTFRIDPGETKPHFLTGHKAGESRLAQSIKAGGKKTVFPEGMTDEQIINAIKTAYKNSEKVKVQNFSTGKVVTLDGKFGNMTIKIHLNLDLKEIESAYPTSFK